MADSTARYVNQAQDVTRSIFGVTQGMAEVQLSILQRLGEVRQGMLSQAFEVAGDELQLISQVRDPRQFASAQADLVKDHGKRYVDSVKQAVDIMVEAWQEYGDRLDEGTNVAAQKAKQGGSSRKSS
jgi:hypothetical protein